MSPAVLCTLVALALAGCAAWHRLRWWAERSGWSAEKRARAALEDRPGDDDQFARWLEGDHHA